MTMEVNPWPKEISQNAGVFNAWEAVKSVVTAEALGCCHWLGFAWGTVSGGSPSGLRP